MRLRRCRCGADHAAGDRTSFSPLADLLPGRTLPDLLYLETRWGALVSYGLAARMVGNVLLMAMPVSPERLRRHLHNVAAHEEAAMGAEPHASAWAWSGCQCDLDDMPPPDGPAYVGVDCSFVRDRAGSCFEGRWCAEEVVRPSVLGYPGMMPFKHNAARRHPIPRARFRVRNWPAYEAGLQRRGDLTLWVDEVATAGWRAPRRSTPGGQPVYADLAIETVLMLRLVFHLALRQAAGLAGSVLHLLNNLFHLCRHQVPASQYRAARTEAFQAWAEVTGAAAAA